jgi:hypothetical protein
MRECLLLLLFTFICHFALDAQASSNPTTSSEQQAEDLVENTKDDEMEDDSYIEQMQQFYRHPININTADEAGLNELKILTPLQIQSILQYRFFFGHFINLYELQAVPLLDIAIIAKLLPFITVNANPDFINSIQHRLKGGEHTILWRVSQILERSKGFKADSATTSNFYPGSPQKLLFRYKYQFKNVLQYGMIGEKDAGEQFFKGKQKMGFDFYTAHFFVRNLGIIRSLAIGDFTINLGQGLVQWQGLAFKKSAEVLNVKRQSAILRPYHSAGETNFHRGLGITLAKNWWQTTFFVSFKNIDANLVQDTTQSRGEYISSLQTSGYHRTNSETSDKAIQQQLIYGGNYSVDINKLHIGLNGIQYKFKLPLQKGNDPYNSWALAGSDFGNYSLDYSLTYKNLHFFGEAAASSNFNKAFINGLLISTANNVDVSLLYRNVEMGYQSLYTNAFTENTYPNNEKGLYVGIEIKPSMAWRIDAYSDFYKFPWLKYRVNAPSGGSGFMIQANYKPNKLVEIYTRFRTESKPINFNVNGSALSPVVLQIRQNWRTQINVKVNTAITIRNRVEMIWFDKKGAQPESGVLTYFDILYNPMLKPLSASLRLQYFETDGYNSRLYAYENDILYSFSIPVLYDQGRRGYINVNYDLGKRWSIWARLAKTWYKGKTYIGSGLDEIAGNKRTEIKLQVAYRW